LLLAGPSTAVALTLLQPPAAGKTLENRPAYKGMIRSKVPALCGVGALFRWLVVRFKIKKVPIPKPGSRQWRDFFLWPGRAGKLWFVHCCVLADEGIFHAIMQLWWQE
jgi:hypothetical protein